MLHSRKVFSKCFKIPSLNSATANQYKLPKLHVRYASNSSIAEVPLRKENIRDPQLFVNHSIDQLLFNYIILKSCSIKPLVKFAPKFVDFSLNTSGSALESWILEKTFYSHFVAGETLEDSLGTVKELGKYGVHSILDYSVEDSTGSFDKTVGVIVDSIRASHENKETIFSCYKMSALSDLDLLERMSELITYQEENPATGTALVEWKNIIDQEPPQSQASREMLIRSLIDSNISGSGVSQSTDPKAPKPLTKDELTRLAEVFGRIEYLSTVGTELNVPILVDAERSWHQPAINWLVLSLASKFNTQTPHLYTTYQMYLSKSLKSLENELKLAEKKQFHLGAKLVRGAYMNSEAQRYGDSGKYPIFSTIQETHNSYNSGVKLALNAVKEERAGLLIASHNEESIIQATNEVVERKIPNKFVSFAQLYGMCDHLSFALADNGYTVCKYVPFGPVREVIPYLVRRVEENSSVLGNTKIERDLIVDAIKLKIYEKIPGLFKKENLH